LSLSCCKKRVDHGRRKGAGKRHAANLDVALTRFVTGIPIFLDLVAVAKVRMTDFSRNGPSPKHGLIEPAARQRSRFASMTYRGYRRVIHRVVNIFCG